MSEDIIPKEQVKEFVTRLYNISDDKKNTLFTPKGFDKLKEKINSYIINLINESYNVSKIHKSENICPDYIEEASNHLIAKTKNRFQTTMGALGGICLGAAISNYLTMSTAAQTTSTYSAIVTGIFGIVGGVLIAYQWIHD